VALLEHVGHEYSHLKVQAEAMERIGFVNVRVTQRNYKISLSGIREYLVMRLKREAVSQELKELSKRERTAFVRELRTELKPFMRNGRFMVEWKVTFTHADKPAWGEQTPENSHMPERVNFSSGTKWEPIVGYSRAVRVERFVYVSGTTATDQNGNLVGVGDASAQTRQTLTNIQTALESLGAKLEDVVRTRIYVTDIAKWEEIGRVHGEFFKNIKPASTMVEVKSLINPQMLVEIEADAIIEHP
jgi:enamine deaminase RidA (YjgF/YER057c/UK114 family)